MWVWIINYILHQNLANIFSKALRNSTLNVVYMIGFKTEFKYPKNLRTVMRFSFINEQLLLFNWLQIPVVKLTRKNGSLFLKKK
jgi:hypothetical protein